MSETRLAQAFARARNEGRPALITYVIPGHPGLHETDAVLDAMVAGGADAVEVGIPFSDPLADGTTIQRVAFTALANGSTPSICIDFVRRARERHPNLPLVFMSYLNPVIAYGLERFATDAAEAGADAIILVDLPPEEADEALQAFGSRGIDVIFLVSPTSSDERLQVIAQKGSGFLYCVSVAGVTGVRNDLSAGLPEFLQRVRNCTPIPLAVGFGISRRAHIEALTGLADGAVVASALMDVVDSTAPQDRAQAVREYVEMLQGRRPS